MTQSRRGFTLVELMIVVIIVGVLATMAVVGYRRMVTSSRSAEAQHVISLISQAQTFEKTNGYVDLSAEWCPTSVAPGTHRVGWNPDCPGTGAKKWKDLTMKSPGDVMFQYRVFAGNGTTLTMTTGASNAGVTTFNGHAVSWGAAAPGPWYIVVAQGDPNGAGSIQFRALSHSQTSLVELEEKF